MKYLALRLPDRELLHTDVPLDDVEFTRGKNQTGEITATLPRATAYQKVTVESDGSTVELIREWGTLIIATDGQKSRSFIVNHADEDEEDQDRLIIQGFGHASIADDTPWTAEKVDYVEEDPLKIVRDIWAHLSSFSEALSINVDPTTSPVRIGEEEREVEFTTGDGQDVAFEVGPYRLNWWSTTDLGKNISDLATETPFEWREHTTFDLDSEAPPTFRIELGYPIIPPIERDLLFEVGINVVDPDQPTDDEGNYYSDVVVLGQGEGSEKRRGTASRQHTGRHRRVKVIEGQGIGSNRLAEEKARAALGTAPQADKFWETITVLPHPATLPGTYDVGDIITVKGETAWGDHIQRSQIVELTHRMADDAVTLTLERAD